jgi:hypothetical protein
MKYAFTFITLSLLLTACGRRDVKLSHQIAGVWQDGPARMAFNSDGSFSTRIPHDRSTNDYAGTWQIRDGFLTMVLTNISGPKPDGRVGDTVRLKIVYADTHHISYVAGAKTNTFSR